MQDTPPTSSSRASLGLSDLVEQLPILIAAIISVTDALNRTVTVEAILRGNNLSSAPSSDLKDLIFLRVRQLENHCLIVRVKHVVL